MSRIISGNRADRVLNKSKVHTASAFIFIISLCLVACSASNDDTIAPESPGLTSQPTSSVSQEPLVITIGNLTDATGPSSNAQAIINMSLEDILNHYNEHNVIDGVRFEIINYDTRMDDSRYLVGYEWLIENEADVIVTGVPGVAEATKERADRDKMMVITYPASKEGLNPPGYVFCIGTTFNDELGYTSLKWISENDTDFPQDRPATIGGAAWNEPYMKTFLAGAEQYSIEHPDQFDWRGSYITDFSFTWDKQIESLKDCDYVIPPQIMYSFVSQYDQAGYSTKFIGIEAQMAFLSLIDDNNKWNAVDGMLFFRTTPWWTDSNPNVTFAKNMLMENHFDQYDEIMESGSGYLAMFCHQIMLGLIEESIMAGSDGFELNPESLYENVQSLSMDIGGAQHTFTSTKRTSANDIKAYVTSAQLEGAFVADPDTWYPIVRLP